MARGGEAQAASGDRSGFFTHVVCRALATPAASHARHTGSRTVSHARHTGSRAVSHAPRYNGTEV